MTVYAPVPAFADRKRHPRALLLILAGHAALIAAVMTAKMDLPLPFVPSPTTVKLIPEPQVPPENPPPPPKQDPRNSATDRVTSVVPVPPPSVPAIDSLPLPLPYSGPIIGPGVDRAPTPAPVRSGPRFATPDSLLKPPYPQQKLRLEEESVLRLRLSIDDRGRVTAVEPVGGADAIFLAAARRHLMAHWRYKPASEDGRPVASTTVITLRFQLDD